MDIYKLYEKTTDFWPSEASGYDDTYRRNVLSLTQERLKYFGELPELTRFFFTDLPVDDELINGNKQLKKIAKKELASMLEQSIKMLHYSDFTPEDLSNRLNELLDQTGQKPVVLFSLIRIATTQAPASPGLAQTLSLLGKERSEERMQAQLARLTSGD